jgi:hypothetical protein
MNRKKHQSEFQSPPYRVIIDRRTDRIVGPVVPVHAEDWPYSEIPFSETLWRYMDFWKFEHLLKHSALYFSRPDRFKDPFEGRLSPSNSAKMSASDAAFCAAYKIQPFTKELEASQEIMRQVVFISCWQRAKIEKREMWEAYTSGPDSIVATTSAKALYRFVRGKIVKSPVKYHSDAFPRTEFGHTTLFYYKPDCYRFEREFRMLLTTGEDEGVRLNEFGRHVPVSLKKIVHRVITHPKSSNELKIKDDEMLKENLKHIQRENSVLLP